jgi:hypothetical protein
MTYVESNVCGEQRDSLGCPVPTGHRLLLGDAPHFACERKGFRPTRDSDVALACHLYCDCCVGVASRCGQGVRVDVKIDAQRRPVDVRTMDIGRVL